MAGGPGRSLAVNGSFLVVLLVGGLRVAHGATSIGDLVAFMLYLTYLLGPIGATFEALSAIQQGVGALQRIEEVTRFPLEADAGAATGEPAGPTGAPSRPSVGGSHH